MNQQCLPVLLTRPRSQSEAFADRLKLHCGDGARIVISPVLEIVWNQRFEQVPTESSLIFTSARAVEVFLQLQTEKNHVAFCVGAQTAELARQAGCRVSLTTRTAEDLIEAMRERTPRERLVWLSGQHVTRALDDALAEIGYSIEKKVVYRQDPLPLTAEANQLLAQPVRVVLPVFSPRSGRLLSAQISGREAQVDYVCLSQAVADAVNDGKAVKRVCPEPTADAMLHLIGSCLSGG